MLFRVMYNGEPVGTSSLEFRDAAMAVAFGTFHPLPSYESIRSVFLLFTDAQPESGRVADQQKLSRYYAERDALNLSLETEDGQRVETGYIHIVDWGPEHDADLEVEVQVIAETFWGHSEDE